MLVKFNKGPRHGKTMQIPEEDREVHIQYWAGNQPRLSFADQYDSTMVAPKFRVALYRMKIMSHPKWGTFPCTDPDGRVYFEYVP